MLGSTCCARSTYPDEDLADYLVHWHGLRQEREPKGPIEEFLVERMAIAMWQMWRERLAAREASPGQVARLRVICHEGEAAVESGDTERFVTVNTNFHDTLAEIAGNAVLAELSAILQTSPKDVQCHRLAAEIHRRAGRLERPRRLPPSSA